ncbi:hypothetical protein LMIY3S_04191 [Labrys miyagiensis]
MPRIRLQVSGIATLAEARIAVAAGADAIGLDPLAFPEAGLAGDDRLADIALALPPPVMAILLTRALTAGTIAQQVDAAAATAVMIMRPLPASEYPGLKRIIRGRKIIQSIAADEPQALAFAAACAEHADALHLTGETATLPPLARQIAETQPLPLFLKFAAPLPIGGCLEYVRPLAIDLPAPRIEGNLDTAAIELAAGQLARQAG